MQRATAAGTHVEFHQRTGLFRVWPALVPLLPEARHTVGDVVTILDRELD